jgi:Septum formation
MTVTDAAAHAARVLGTALLLLALGGCGQGSAHGAKPVSASTRPAQLGACRALSPGDISHPSNDTATVSCSTRHTAQTFAVGTFPHTVADGGPDAAALGSYVYRHCQPTFRSFLGGTDSLMLRSTLTWAWFRPSRAAWDDGAHTWRCDAVGGTSPSGSLAALPTTARGLLLGKPDDRWLVCVNGPTVSGAAKIPCSAAHTWRAVTTVLLGKPGDPYPGDRLAQVRTRDFCSDSVGAWLNYPVDYDYGYTTFHAAEWKAGNR